MKIRTCGIFPCILCWNHGFNSGDVRDVLAVRCFARPKGGSILAHDIRDQKVGAGSIGFFDDLQKSLPVGRAPASTVVSHNSLRDVAVNRIDTCCSKSVLLYRIYGENYVSSSSNRCSSGMCCSCNRPAHKGRRGKATPLISCLAHNPFLYSVLAYLL